MRPTIRAAPTPPPIAQGYDPGPADGVLSAATQEALRQFQAANGLPATGFLSVETVRRLGVRP